MSTSIVVLDTNILARSPFLDSEDWKQLHAHATDWGLSFMVPEVVVIETVNVVQRSWKPNITQLTQAAKWISALGKSAEFQAILDAASERHDSYDSSLRCRMDELGIAIAPLPATIDHLDIARRASERRAPYGTAGSGKEEHPKDGYRDTLIWLTVLAVAENHPASDVWFVSNNYSDFGSKNEVKDPQDVSDYPLAWHSQLTPELASKGLTDRVFYARSLRRLEEHLVAKFAPLPDTERDTLWAAVERSELHDRLMSALFDAPVDPRSSALPLDTLSARITGCERAADAVQLTEAARRAASAWTARFSCTVEATIEVTHKSGDVTDMSKPLVIVGRIDVSSQNEVTGLAIDAIDAAADDPQRRAWERADAVKTFYSTLLNRTTPAADYSKLIRSLDLPAADYSTFIRSLDLPAADYSTFIRNLDLPVTDYSTFIRNLDLPAIDYSSFIRNLDLPAIDDATDEPEDPDDKPDVKPES
ncbi:DUF4935 domain-containing protein [Rhodococcus hoagii]|nr:DUF4935 domain-containing protein [Prescottella equi]